MICPHCKQDIEEKPAALVTINGKPQKIVRRSAITRLSRNGKRYAGRNYSPAIPLLIVEERPQG